MKTLLICFILIPTFTFAAAPTKFVWDRNTETDMLEYSVYACSTSAVCIPNLKIGTVAQPAIGNSPSFPIPSNTQGRAAVTAVDLIGNESGQSNIISYDRQSPANPLNLRAE